jgi:hypothetical protein
VELREALRTIATLQQKRLASGDLGQIVSQGAGLAGEHQRRKGGQLRLDIGQRLGVGIVGHLQDRLGAPAIGAPALGHGINS